MIDQGMMARMIDSEDVEPLTDYLIEQGYRVTESQLRSALQEEHIAALAPSGRVLASALVSEWLPHWKKRGKSFVDELAAEFGLVKKSQRRDGDRVVTTLATRDGSRVPLRGAKRFALGRADVDGAGEELEVTERAELTTKAP